MSFAVGSLVKARGREWVVLPESDNDFVVLRPLGGTEEEVAGIHLSLEHVEPAQFALPDPRNLGDYRSCRLLRDAVRLGFRSSAGPFRSFARIAVEPRPYQLVPLLVGLKLDPVRVLIADDVGIGKTIEACLIARELLDRGEVDRLAVLCPPALAEQWQGELNSKFHIDAELVLPSTATRLERNCRLGQSLFDIFPYVIVSTDFIKSDRRRDEFLRTCPKLVIVDEAHTCAFGGVGRGGRHQRHQLLAGLSGDPERHLILVTATPHSGNEEAFRSLLTLLNPAFANLPQDLTGRENEHHRRDLAKYFVQRRRADIRHFLNAHTPFPDREDLEETYNLSGDYKRFFERVLNYARESVRASDGSTYRQRVRWWSALALLRSLASSPAAAEATLRSRAPAADAETVEQADDLSQRNVEDLIEDESTEGADLAPGSDSGGEADEDRRNRRRLLEMAIEAERLKGQKDEKLKKAIKLIKTTLEQGFQPIIFCRFIPTADYVAAELRKELPAKVEVASITSVIPPAEREERVNQLVKAEKHVLVCTDCLSEGINLQEHFDAVFHYDLSWNPTRHEQREGRVDRYGQPKKKVRTLMYYGTDNQIDGIVLDVLIRKHKKIKSSLGISVPVPVDTEQVVEAIFEGLLLRTTHAATSQDQLALFEDLFKPEKEAIHKQWDVTADREKRSQTMFAQEAIAKYVDEVGHELKAVQSAIGSGTDVAAFTREGLRAHKALLTENGAVHIDLTEVPRALREAVGEDKPFTASFTMPVRKGEIYLTRTHPVVEGLATYIMDTALDALGGGVARRCGATRTDAVDRRTTVLLLRFRYHIITRREGLERPLLAEDCQLAAFEGPAQGAQWLDNGLAERLLHATPKANVLPDQAINFLTTLLEDFDAVRPRLVELAHQRGKELLECHQRVRDVSRVKGVSYRVEPQLPPDVLGVYVYLPVGGQRSEKGDR